MSERMNDHTADSQLRGKFFAVIPGTPRDRRPTDVTMLVLSSVVIWAFARRVGGAPGTLERALIDLVAALPTFLDPVWSVMHDALTLWVVVILITSLWRKQWGLVRDMLVGVAASIFIAACLGRITNGVWPDLSDGLLSTDHLVEFPAIGLSLNVALASIASSHLSRPYRYFSRWLLAFAGLATFALGVTTPSGSAAAVALGFALAAAVHLVFGSPGGLPSLEQVRAAIAVLGVDATPDERSRQSGLVRVSATGASGEQLDVKVYGRDAWDGQLIVSLWRFMWYRDSGPTLKLTRLQQVEHEAFLTLLAERRGAFVQPVVTAGVDSIGDALLVTQRLGIRASEVAAPLDDRLLHQMWHSLERLHLAGVTHGAIGLDRLHVDGDVVRIGDLSSGEVQSTPAAFLVDKAQLLTATAVLVGIDRAVAAAGVALGMERLAELSSYVQPAALSPQLRRDLARANLDVDDVRAAAVLASGAGKRDLQRLRRLTVGRVLMGVLLFIAGYTLVTGLLEIGLDTIVDSMRGASFPIVVLAFCISLLSRPVNAYGLSALAPTPIPLGRLTVLMFAMNFVSLAMPSTAGRVAVNIRFFQRSGVEPTTAVAIGALDGFTGFICQVLLTGSILLFGLGTLELQIDHTFSFDAVAALLWALLIVLVAGVGVLVFVRPVREWIVKILTHVRAFLGPLLRSPKRLGKALGANMTSELIYSFVLYTVLAAYHQSVWFPDIVFVGIGVSLFAGLMPVPGGIGVTEAGLTAGFIMAGVPQATAFAAALTVRMITFYVPPLIGWFALRWLQRRRFL